MIKIICNFMLEFVKRRSLSLGDDGESACHDVRNPLLLFFKKIGQPRPLFHFLRSFQTNNTIFTTNQSEKMSSPSSI